MLQQHRPPGSFRYNVGDIDRGLTCSVPPLAVNVQALATAFVDQDRHVDRFHLNVSRLLENNLLCPTWAVRDMLSVELVRFCQTDIFKILATWFDRQIAVLLALSVCPFVRFGV